MVGLILCLDFQPLKWVVVVKVGSVGLRWCWWWLGGASGCWWLGFHLLLHVEEAGERERETDESMWGRGLMRAHVREKINKIVIYTFTVTVQICTVIVANVYIYTTIVGLMLNKFRIYYVKFVFLYFLFCTILHPLMWVLLENYLIWPF